MNANANRAERRDRRAWEQAQELNSLDGYRAYLNAFPNGVFADEAQARVRVYEEEAANANALARAPCRRRCAGSSTPSPVSWSNGGLNALGLKPGRVGRTVQRTHTGGRFVVFRIGVTFR